MPRTFSPSQTPWEDGDNLRIDKTELTALLAVMDSGGDVKAALKVVLVSYAYAVWHRCIDCR